ncbi:Ig-like domain-containing protein [Gryllotalpicola protaetiae]|uniref:Right-handed parallel beta-helix repeat-containing protein n=1 Tax=Gryllotalpicola protaetiae TaxID=2419771 RepID=A0A387BM28_9MICO|nr:Ig-like domain-containing protein [Gryllotalpicola protaetiae]AYG03718.1 right-handed parallel beta-helix repeat-containing protein [Gryllotalpicola protaetiae]
MTSGWGINHGRARRRSFAALTAVVGLVVAGVIALAAPAAAATTLYASPTGTGSTCSSAAPCSLPTAVAAAPAGATIQLTAGTYPAVTVKGGHGTAAAPVTITPASGAAATLTTVTDQANYLTWKGVLVTAAFYLTGTGDTVSGAHIDGGGLFVRGTDATVTGSLFENGSSIDGIQVGNAYGVTIAGNTVRNYNQSTNNGMHADCIQIFDSANVVVERNNLSNCYNSGLILSVGAGHGIYGVTIEDNFISGCITVTTLCGGGSAVDLREASTVGLVLRNNTLGAGAARLGTQAGTVADRNVIAYLSDCSVPLTNSVVASWNTKLCGATLPLLQTGGNKAGSVRFANAAANDLHLTAPADATVKAVATTVPRAPTDVDGDATSATIAGADTPKGTGAATAADTTAPKTAITAPKSGSTVTGTVTLIASASDNVGLTDVIFRAGGATLGPATKASDGSYRLTASTASFPKGTYSVTSVARDAAGNVTTSAAATLTLK